MNIMPLYAASGMTTSEISKRIAAENSKLKGDNYEGVKDNKAESKEAKGKEVEQDQAEPISDDKHKHTENGVSQTSPVDEQDASSKAPEIPPRSSKRLTRHCVSKSKLFLLRHMCTRPVSEDESESIDSFGARTSKTVDFYDTPGNLPPPAIPPTSEANASNLEQNQKASKGFRMWIRRLCGKLRRVEQRVEDDGEISAGVQRWTP